MDKITILIVEDEEFISLEIASRLQRLGYAVCKNVTNAPDTIKEVKRCNPDIILMDIRIKGEVDGIELAKTIRATKKIPIIYITAFSDPHTLNRAKETLPYGYLTKPISDKDLLIALELASYRIKVDRELEYTQQQLINSEIKYRTVVNHTYDWEYWLHDGNVRYISLSVERITGYAPQEFINDPSLISRIVFNEDTKVWLNHICTREINSEPSEAEFRIIRKDGEVRWIEHICRYIIDESGQNLGLRVSNRDITQQKELERQLITNTIDVEESERNRYSRELHDGLGPLLATIKLYFQWLSETDDEVKAKMLAEKGMISIDRAIETAREVSHGLSPLHINNDGFVKALQNFVDDINSLNKLSVIFTSNITLRFNGTLEIMLYRIATELLNNTLKYAQATKVDITCTHLPERNIIQLSYTDNGKGFDAARVTKTSRGLGLPNIESRAKSLGGIFIVESGEDIGTKVIIELPFAENIV